MTDYDSPWKEALDDYLEPCLALLFPQAHAEVDWSRGFEALDKELQQIAPEGEVGKRYVDKLVKVWLKNGAEEWLLIHLEVQTWPESGFAQRIYVYNYRIFDRYNRKVASLAVLADDRQNWRPDRYGYSVLGCEVSIAFPVVKLLDFAAAEEALERHDNPFATVVLAHLKTLQTRRDPGERLAWKTRLARGLFERGRSAQDVRKLFRFIDWIMDLPKAMNELFWEKVDEVQQEKTMPYVSSGEQVWLGRGLRKGRLEALEVALRLKFGEEGLKLMPELTGIEDIDLLLKIREVIEAAATLEEVRAALPG